LLYIKKKNISFLFTHWEIITPILERDLTATVYSLDLSHSWKEAKSQTKW